MFLVLLYSVTRAFTPNQSLIDCIVSLTVVIESHCAFQRSYSYTSIETITSFSIYPFVLIFFFVCLNLVGSSDAQLIINGELKKVIVSSICLRKSLIRNMAQTQECVVSKLSEVCQITSEITAIQMSSNPRSNAMLSHAT